MNEIDNNFYKVLFEDLDPKRLRKRFLKLLLDIQSVERGSIWIRQKEHYVCVESLGGPANIDIVKGTSLRVEDKSIVRWVMEHGEMTIAEAGKDPRHHKKIEQDMMMKSNLILAFPLILKNGRVYGVVEIIDTSAGGSQLNLDKQYLRLLKNIIDMGAIAFNNALQYSEQIERNAELAQTLDEIRNKVHIIGQSPSFLKAMKRVRDYARTNFPVLITGESGTGKDLVASAIHKLSSRKDKPFVVQNCSAIPNTLLESELFGYKKGAFTGATQDKAGILMAADGGTVFLDEIGDMSLQLQARILRVIQNNEIKLLGESNTRIIDVRIISATNKDLVAAVKQKTFREDLFYRLNVLPLHLPPLRERKNDISLLLNYFIRKESLALGIPQKRVSDEALAYLLQYHWEGNIRELENFAKYILSTVEDAVVKANEIPDYIKHVEFKKEHPNESLPVPEEKANTLNVPILEAPEIPFGDYSWDELDREYVNYLLVKNKWVVARAARDAGVKRSTFDSRMKKLGFKK
jgi:transcriptional regulator with GAF, ATPase, and Fis domain